MTSFGCPYSPRLVAGEGAAEGYSTSILAGRTRRHPVTLAALWRGILERLI
jgi:hypothetical protein